MISKMKNNVKLLSLVLLSAVMLATVQTTSASTDTYRALFGCSSVGRGLLYWGGALGSNGIDPSGTFSGLVMCSGSAMVDGPYDIGIGVDAYFALPGSVCCEGLIVARWKYEGDRYLLKVSLSPTEEASGLFIPEGEFFTVSIPEGPLQLSYTGKIIKNGVKQSISGLAGIGVSEAESNKFIIFVFELELEDGEPRYVSLQWIEDWTQIFHHNVKLLDS